MREEDLIDGGYQCIRILYMLMFGYSKLISINKTRYLHFKSNCKPKDC